MANTSQHFADAAMLIREPVAQVFEAFIDPAVTAHFWFTKGTGRLEQGKAVEWTWEMYDHTITVHVQAVQENERIVIEWGEGHERSTVEWTFQPLSATSTFVSIRNTGFKGDMDHVIQQVRDSTGGFTLVLAGLKAWLEHGIELGLVGDRFPQGLEQH
jgi:uncharacterized protein YndB with AHSA1/START domain